MVNDLSSGHKMYALNTNGTLP